MQSIALWKNESGVPVLLNPQPLIDAVKAPAKPHFETLLQFISADDWRDPRCIAYVLATTQHEVGGTWQPITERGAPAYFNKYEPGTDIGKRLGNKNVGDGFKFRGRGFCQITGLDNYRRFTAILRRYVDRQYHAEVDLVADPDKALVPAIAYTIMSVGMTEGEFTRKKLADYIQDDKCDYVNARRIINSDVNIKVPREPRTYGQKIGAYAAGWEQLMLAAVI